MSIVRGNYDENGIGTKNQCTMTIRSDGSEIEIPINFGLTSDEIRGIYPYLLSIANRKVENPAIMFTSMAKKGQFDDISDEVYGKLLATVERQSRLWYNKPEASILDLAMRIAVDITMDPNHWLEHFSLGTDIDEKTGEDKIEDGGMTNLVSGKEKEEVDEIMRSVTEDDEQVYDPTLSDQSYEQPEIPFNIYGKWAGGDFDDEEDIEARQWSDEDELQEDAVAGADDMQEGDYPFGENTNEEGDGEVPDNEDSYEEAGEPEGESSDGIEPEAEPETEQDSKPEDEEDSEEIEDPLVAFQREKELTQALFAGGMAGLDTMLKANDEYDEQMLEHMQYLNDEFNGGDPTLDDKIEDYMSYLSDEDFGEEDDVPGEDVFDDDFEFKGDEE